jgi:hypothetical protein
MTMKKKRRERPRTGAAAASIAALAIAHGAAAEDPVRGVGCGRGWGDGSGVCSGFKQSIDAIDAFHKGEGRSAEIRLEQRGDAVEAFMKGSNRACSVVLGGMPNLEGADAYFGRVDAHGATFVVEDATGITISGFFVEVDEGLDVIVQKDDEAPQGCGLSENDVLSAK